MAWFMDEYSKNERNNPFAVVTGKPLIIGGSLGRDSATGRGVSINVEEAARHLKMDLKKSTCAIQGFGNVGSFAHMFLEEAGVKVVAVSDSKGGATRRTESGSTKSQLTRKRPATSSTCRRANPLRMKSYWSLTSTYLSLLPLKTLSQKRTRRK